MTQTPPLLPHLCPENHLIKMPLSRQMPGVGDSDFSCEQAGRSFGGTLSVFAPPTPGFRRVEARVRDGSRASAHPLLTVATVVGRF